MNNPKLYTGVKIYWCNHFITLDEEIRKVESKDPSAIIYENGMTSFNFVDIVEYSVFGTPKTKIVREDDKKYFFGEFISLDDLKASNTNGQWDNAIYNIEGSNGIGMVTSPNGFHSIMPENGVIVNELSQIKRR